MNTTETPTKPKRIRNHDRGNPALHECDCGRVAVHYFGGWECQKCLDWRLWNENYTRTHQHKHDTSPFGWSEEKAEILK